MSDNQRWRTACPHCGNRPRLEPGLGYLVCRGCAEFLYVNELVADPRHQRHPAR